MTLFYSIFFKLINNRLKYGSDYSIIINLEDRKCFIIGTSKSAVKVYIKNKYCLVKLIFFGLPYLGISYSKGHWTTNNLYKLLQLGINNKKALRSILFLNFPFKFYHWVLTDYISHYKVFHSDY